MWNANGTLDSGLHTWLASELACIPAVKASRIRSALEVAAKENAVVPERLPYRRKCLWSEAGREVLLMFWASHVPSAIHDHGGGHGKVLVVQGELLEERWGEESHLRHAAQPLRYHHCAGSSLEVGPKTFHRMVSVGRLPARSLHVYHGVNRGMRLPDPSKRRTWLAPMNHGAWLPVAETQREEEHWS
jgi:hypothetical protein